MRSACRRRRSASSSMPSAQPSVSFCKWVQRHTASCWFSIWMQQKRQVMAAQGQQYAAPRWLSVCYAALACCKGPAKAAQLLP
eukprot:1157288-Pelagomonas_calceolata.AAC.4